jgi:hypothetical protein
MKNFIKNTVKYIVVVSVPIMTIHFSNVCSYKHGLKTGMDIVKKEYENKPMTLSEKLQEKASNK